MLSQFITVGIDEETRGEIGDLPKGHGILGMLIRDPRPLRLPDLTRAPRQLRLPAQPPADASFLGVPILVRGQAFGNLYLCDKRRGEVLHRHRRGAGGRARGRGRRRHRERPTARTGRRRRRLFEDRERIARDLHDTVIQRLFAVGLGLQGAARLTSDPALVARLESAVDELDTTVREIRSTIFELHAPRLPGRSARQATIVLIAEAARTLGFEPTVHFDGPVDAAVDDELAEHLLAVEREALANVAKHAAASAVDVTITARDGVVTLLVEDDGAGPSQFEPGGRGLENMKSRAQQLGGKFVFEARPGGGSVLRWSAASQR